MRKARPADDPGITRLPPLRSYRTDKPQETADLLAQQQQWFSKWRESAAWTLDGFFASVERSCLELAPEWVSREELRKLGTDWRTRRRALPAKGTVKWLAEKVLDHVELVRTMRGNETDEDVIQAFHAGQWYGHLVTKLDWERKALDGDAVQAGRRRGGTAARAARSQVLESVRAEWWNKNLALRHQKVARRVERVARIVAAFGLNRDADFRRVRDYLAARERKAGLHPTAE